ncbi:MAG: iron ABC transporter permease [Eggerthellaceae bacterium]|nr:iron ABC transporter permease [Eggerthellaceae bacterium]
MSTPAVQAAVLKRSAEESNNPPMGDKAQAAFADEAEKSFSERVPLWMKIALPVALAAIVLVSFALGKYSVSPAELAEGVGRHFQGEITTNAELSLDKIIFNIRIPRILLVVFVGAALSAAGASFQGMFRNPLVSPDLLGASAGAGLGACIGLLLGWSVVLTQLMAFATGLLAVGIAVFMNRMVKYDRLLGLVLGGILVSTLFQAGTSIVKLCADVNDKLPSITYWLMGSFSGSNQRDLLIAILPMFIGFALIMSQRWRLNVLSLGEDEARSLGVNTKRTRLIVIVAATLLTSVSVAVSGVIGWIGLIIPHLARALVGPDHRKLIPAAMILGSSYLLIVDDIARCALSMEIPIGILTALLGVPFFAIIFRRNSKGWG